LHGHHGLDPLIHGHEQLREGHTRKDDKVCCPHNKDYAPRWRENDWRLDNAYGSKAQATWQKISATHLCKPRMSATLVCSLAAVASVGEGVMLMISASIVCLFMRLYPLFAPRSCQYSGALFEGTPVGAM
jgi:hypothetical protein